METLFATLVKYPESTLGQMFLNNEELTTDSNGVVFIDSDPTLFRHVLQDIRRGVIHENKAPNGVSNYDWTVELEHWKLTSEYTKNEVEDRYRDTWRSDFDWLNDKLSDISSDLGELGSISQALSEISDHLSTISNE